MDNGLPPRSKPASPDDPASSPAEPELGTALRLLGAALTALLRRVLRHAERALAGAVAAASRWGAAARRLWVRRSALGAPLRGQIEALRQLRVRRPASGRSARSSRPADAASPPAAPVPGPPVGQVPPPRRHRGLRFLLWTGGGAVLALAAFLAYCLYTLPLATEKPAAATPAALVLKADNGQPFATRGVYKGQWVPANQLPGDFVHAVVAIEDRRFFRHPGIDFWGIARAAFVDLVTGSAQQGGSTITQQLVRMDYLSPKRTIVRKVQEALLAIWLEHRLSKIQILTRYVNTAYYGAGAYGIDAAAERYFGKHAPALDLSESAMLAGLVNAPSALAPTSNPQGAEARADEVLKAMVEQNYITPAQAAAARAHPAQLVVPPATEPGRNYFADTAEAEVKSLIGVPLSDLTVKTTLDPALQDLAERVVAHWLARDGKRLHIGQAALVALAPDGAVLAMVGGRNYNESQFNRVTQALRQPGSLFKIFVYLAALDDGYTPDSVLADRPVDINGWKPKDYERRYRGPVTLQTAFADSINTISAQLVQNIGVDRVIAMAKSLGVTTPLPAVPSLALGTADVTLLEMTRAMDTIATDTRSITPYTVAAISARSGAPLYTHSEPQVERPSWHWRDMMDLLQAVVKSGTGRAAQLDRPVGGKTGTTNDYRDAWFVGFTTDFVVGVWCGNDDNSPMKDVTGGSVPAHIWHDFVAGAERIEARETAGKTARVSFDTGAPGADSLAALPPDSAPTPEPALAPGETIAGIPLIVDTGTLMFQGHLVHLAGVEGETGQSAEEMAQFIAGRPVTCRPDPSSSGAYDCRVGGTDLARTVLYNGGGRAAPDAPPTLKAAEEQAREAGRGLWGQ